MRKPQLVFVIALAGGLAACGESSSLQVSDGTGPSPKLPEPNKTLIPTVNIAPAIGWPDGGKPTAAAGTQVAAFAEGLDHPRWLYVLPNGDVLVAETNAPPKPDDSSGIRGWVMKKVMGKAGAGVPSPNRITLLRDADHDGVAETRTVFLQNLNSPFGMTLVGNDLYVADTDRLLRFHYEPGATEIKSQPIKVIDLPGGTLNHHWTKNVIASKDGSKLYVTVGSNSNVGENGLDKEEGRAAIWEVDRATGNHRIFASGIRNPNGLAWEPTSGALWTAVNERDEIGSDLVPDYITSVKDGGFYGWPFSYYGQHVDVRVDAAKSGSGGQGHRPGLRGRPAHRLAGPDVRRGQHAAGAVQGRRVHRPARLVEPQTAQWLQSDFRAVQRRQAERQTGGCADRFPRQGRECTGSPGGRGDRSARWLAGGR